jgi:hypothetical protein
MYKDNQNEKVMRKTLPKNSTPDRFLVIPQTLNSHYRDPRRLNKHQIPPSNHQTQKTRKEVDVCDCFKETEHMYAQLAEGQPTYICQLSSKNQTHICFKNKARQGRRMKKSDPE